MWKHFSREDNRSRRGKIVCRRTITRDKQGYYIMIKGSIHQEDITLLNKYVPNKRFKIHEVKTVGR